MRNYILPVGIEEFSEIREGYYYIDKTRFLRELLSKTFKVNLITRPRRFGKTLTMSMMADFLDIRKDSRPLFAGLYISQEDEICSRWMNQWPVLSLTLKSVESIEFEGAYGLVKKAISDLCKEHAYLLDGDKIDNDDREIFRKLKAGTGDETELKSSLFTMMRMMNAYFGKQVVLLIDEYDVPLAKASENGYYEQMLDLIRGIFGIVLKGNRFLKFAVVTGCLRIAKESIFTGTNNFVSDTISDARFDEDFGFTESEVLRLLEDTGLTAHTDEIKKWYDGYRFGTQEVYCPWDVLNYVNALLDKPSTKPKNYWKNTSHNSIIRSFIDRTDLAVNEKFELLLNGGCIKEAISENLTYDVLHSSESNLWSVLYLTGYLTKAWIQDEPENGELFLKIPNEEIRNLFVEEIAEWFKATVMSLDRKELFNALWGGEADTAAKLISDILFTTISYHDYRESYYHAFIAGIFSGAGYAVESNYEYGLGRPDIVVKDMRQRRVMIFEAKKSVKESDLENDCMAALEQVDGQAYMQQFLDGYEQILCYGIAFYKKKCRLIKHI